MLLNSNSCPIWKRSIKFIFVRLKSDSLLMSNQKIAIKFSNYDILPSSFIISYSLYTNFNFNLYMTVELSLCTLQHILYVIQYISTVYSTSKVLTVQYSINNTKFIQLGNQAISLMRRRPPLSPIRKRDKQYRLPFYT